MGEYLVPIMFNRVRIRAFGWPVHDPWFFRKVIVARKLCGGALSWISTKLLRNVPLVLGKGFCLSTRLWTCWFKGSSTMTSSCPWSERRPIPWSMAPHCHLFFARKHQYICPFYSCELESDRHCDIAWSGTRQRRHSASSAEGANHGVTVTTANGVNDAVLLAEVIWRA